MIKIALRHPSGLEIEFEGDKDAFDRFAQFLSADLSGFVRALNPAPATIAADHALPAPQALDGILPEASGSAAEGPVLSLGSDETIDPRAVALRLEQIGASSDMERVAVLAQAAVDAGLVGIDSDTASKLYTEMGIPKPARFAKTFSNAGTRGLIRSVKYGVWAPTVQGENYARYGRKPTPRRSGRRGSPGSSMAVGELEVGGWDPDEDVGGEPQEE